MHYVHFQGQWRGARGGVQPPERAKEWFLPKNSQFFAPVAPIGSVGQYFYLNSVITKTKKFIILSKKSVNFFARLSGYAPVQGKYFLSNGARCYHLIFWEI